MPGGFELGPEAMAVPHLLSSSLSSSLDAASGSGAADNAHDAWKEYARTVGESSADMLTCDVGVSGGAPFLAFTWDHRAPGSRRMN